MKKYYMLLSRSYTSVTVLGFIEQSVETVVMRRFEFGNFLSVRRCKISAVWFQLKKNLQLAG